MYAPPGDLGKFYFEITSGALLRAAYDTLMVARVVAGIVS